MSDNSPPTPVAPLRVYTPHAQFDTPPEVGAEQATSVNGARVRFNLRNRSRLLADGAYEVTLELTVACERGGQTLYRAEVHQAGTFDLSGLAAADKARSVNTDGPRVLFPLAQKAANALVENGGFAPFQLPAVDFDRVYARQQDAGAHPEPMAILQKFWQAVAHLQELARRTPRPTDFRATHREALAVAQLSRDALPAADKVLATTPGDRQTLAMLSAAYSMNNQHRRTVAVYRLDTATRPTDARAHYNLAAALMFNGDLAGAEQEVALSIRQQPTFWDAYTVQSQVRKQTREHNHIEDLTTLLHAHGSSNAQAAERLHMALAKELADLGEHAPAFAHLAAGNRIGKLRRGYTFQHDQAVFDALMHDTPEAQAAAVGYPTDEPIFVFGMPRSGTTLVDRILSSHPEVSSAGELKQFGMLLKCAADSPTEAIFDVDMVHRSRTLDWRALGATYLAATRPLSGQTPRFIDKFPHHFLYAGYIANALPGAKLICVRRHPMDTCLGNFRQVFSEGSPFHGYACDLIDAGHYYVAFDRLMAHWRQAFPGRILEIQYEALVADQAAVTRSLLEFCGLAWNPACLHFEQNRAPVATASAVQVRSPMYRDAVGRWKTYAPQLEPLRALLVDAGIAVAAP